MAENMIQHIAQEQEKKIALHEQAIRLHTALSIHSKRQRPPGSRSGL